MAQYTKEQYWKLYEKLPQTLKEAVFSNDVAEHIATACERNQIQEMSQVAAAVGDVLMGITMPQDFQQTLQKQIGLKPATAQSVAQEINRFIFFPVRAELEDLHRAPGEKSTQTSSIGVETPRHADNQNPHDVQDDYVVQEAAEQPEQQSTIRKADTYRESIE